MLKLLHEDISKLKRVSVVLESQPTRGLDPGQLCVMQDDLPVEDHRETVALYRDDITVLLSNLVICRHSWSKRCPNWKRLFPIVANTVDLTRTNGPIPEVHLGPDCSP